MSRHFSFHGLRRQLLGRSIFFGAITFALTILSLRIVLPSHRRQPLQASQPLNLPAPRLSIRSNTLNSALPGWLGYDLDRQSPAQLDVKGLAVRRGQGLVCMMRDAVGSTPASKYQEISDLIQYGYRASFTDHPEDGDDTFIADLGLSKAFRALEIPFSGWTQISVGNTFDVRDPKDSSKVVYPASHATFSTEINLQSGAMIATQSYGPEYMAAKFELKLNPEAGEALTPLQKVSDLLFLSWKKLIQDRGGGSLKNLEHMFRWNTIVPEVQGHLKMAAGGKEIEEIGEWPGVSYPVTELQGLATLSSPNAKGVAWLLGQHKEAMGVKTVDRVNIFNCPDIYGDAQWCVYLHIVPVEDPA